MKIVKIFLYTLFLISAYASKGQNPEKTKISQPSYTSAIGVKFYPTAITFKTMSGKKNAIELLAYFKDGFRLTGLYEIHGILNNGKNLRWYAGLGGHLGLGNKNEGNDFKFGVDGVLGLDYKLMHLPLNISLDWQPTLAIGDESVFSNWGGLAARFAF